jgi:valyl-tRNA synthetase
MELSKTYNPKEIEGKLYNRWLENKYFHATIDENRQPFTIVMPPPNVTGELHMGHALNNTIQDILIRYKRMEGYNTLWVPGTDHAAIATEVKVIDRLREEGIDKDELGREGFLERTWQWKDEYASRINNQLTKLGVSCDWARERFTMDEGCSRAVEESFLQLYEKGYIYKGSRIINWCPKCMTSLSDAEVEHEDTVGNFYHIKYPIIDSYEYVIVATTRPETMLGDSGVVVHPEDERYNHLIGKKVLLPLMNRELTIIADDYADKDLGTGAVKMTPAHDPNDFEIGKRHNLAEINVMNDDATINENGGKYAGLDRYVARKEVLKDLEELGLLEKVKPHEHSIGKHDRCGVVVEPLIKQQWFVRMDELAKPAIKALETGELKFVPERFGKVYLRWLENIRDWCISRQIWWGHRIPAFYCDCCGEMVVAKDAPKSCPKCKDVNFTQDEDTLDTWFSSALWPFSTLGWPKETEDLKYFYPTDVLVTSYDIIFFWVVRMVFSGYEYTGKSPFHTTLINSLIRDAKGKKMSKSAGNGIDPLDIIEQYGADALRLTLVTGHAPGNDMRFHIEKVEASRNFANKVWNASRFIQMNLDNQSLEEPAFADLTIVDQWILSKVNSLAKEMTENMAKYELGIAVQKVYDFIWDEFCDWYIELAKKRIYQKEDNPKGANCALWVLKTVLGNALKMLHPFMPFVTEEIYQGIVPEEESLMMSSWPIFTEEWNYPEAEQVLEQLKEIVRGVRNVRAEMNVENSRKTKIYVVTGNELLTKSITSLEESIIPLMNGSQILVSEDKPELSDDAVSIVTSNTVVYLPLEDLVDFEQERERLRKEEDKLVKEINRAKGMLANEKFISKAPQAKIEEEKVKLEKFNQMLIQVQERLSTL